MALHHSGWLMLAIATARYQQVLWCDKVILMSWYLATQNTAGLVMAKHPLCGGAECNA